MAGEAYRIPMTWINPLEGSVEERSLLVQHLPDGDLFGEESGLQQFVTPLFDEYGRLTYLPLDRLMNYQILPLTTPVEEV